MAARVLLAILWLLTGQAAALAQATEGDDAPLRFGRFEAEGAVRYGFLSVGGVHEIDRSYFAPDAVTTGRVFALDQAKLLAPVTPGKVLAVSPGKAGPVAFAKLPSSVVGDHAVVQAPAGETLTAEAEVVVVISRRARNVTEADAPGHVAGVTAGLDVALAGASDPPHLAQTGRDTFAPVGPWIVPGLWYDRLEPAVTVNGKTVAGASGKMIASVAALVSELSRQFTLEPGDVIFAGTRGRAFALKPGDTVEVALDGVGVLRVTVEAGK